MKQDYTVAVSGLPTDSALCQKEDVIEFFSTRFSPNEVLERRRVIRSREGVFDSDMDRSSLGKGHKISLPSAEESSGASEPDDDCSDDSASDSNSEGEEDGGGKGEFLGQRRGKKWGASNSLGLFPVSNIACSVNSTTSEEEARRLYLGTWVAQVAVAHPDGPAIREFRAKQELLLELRRARARTLLHAQMDYDKWAIANAQGKAKAVSEPSIPVESQDLEANNSENDFQKYIRPKDLAAVRKLEQGMVSNKKRKESLGDGRKTSGFGLIGQARMQNDSENVEGRRKVIGAFVVFKHEESYVACLTEYALSNVAGGGCCGILSLCMKYCQPKHLQFHGVYPLRVERASDPTDILWENFDTSPKEKCLRRCAGNLITFILLMISFGVSTVGIIILCFEPPPPPPDSILLLTSFCLGFLFHAELYVLVLSLHHRQLMSLQIRIKTDL